MYLVVALTINSIVLLSYCDSLDLPCLQMIELGDHACESYDSDETLEHRKHNEMFIVLSIEGGSV